MDNETIPKRNKFFQAFDYFSVQYSFRINDENAYKSNFGGIAFILYFLFSIFYFGVSFSHFWNGRNYSINYSVTSNKRSGINIKKTNFTFAYINNFSFIQKYIKADIFYNSNNYSKIIKSKNCEFEDFSDKINKTTFKMMRLETFNCIDFNKEDSEKIRLSGNEFDNDRSYYSIEIRINKDIISNPLNFEQFQNSFTSQNIHINPFQIYWFDYTVDVRQIENPIETIFNFQKIFLEANKTKIMNMYISKMEFSSDENIFFSNKISTNLSFVDKIKENSYFSSKNFNGDTVDDCIVRVYLNFSKRLTTIDRRYKKLDEFLAEFGGINSNLLLILSIFVKIINEFWAEEKLMNKILKFREYMKVSNPNHINLIKENLKKNRSGTLNFNKNKNINQNKNIKTFFQSMKEDLDNIQEPKIDNTSQFSQEMFNKNEKMTSLEINVETKQREPIHDLKKSRNSQINRLKEEKLLEEMKKPIFFNCFEIILRLCFCKSSKLYLKNLLYQKALKKLNNYLDIINYIKKMQEIDILKFLLLDEDQVKIFNFLTMPSISMKYSDSDDYYKNLLRARVNKGKLDSDELHELIKSYNVIKNKNDELNNRLFYLFDNEVDHLLIDS